MRHLHQARQRPGRHPPHTLQPRDLGGLYADLPMSVWGLWQAALCLKGVETYDDETVVELLLVNTGKVPLCELRVALDQVQQHIVQ